MGKRKPRGGYRAGARCVVYIAGGLGSLEAVIIRSMRNGKFEVKSVYSARVYEVMRKQIRLTGVNHER